MNLLSSRLKSGFNVVTAHMVRLLCFGPATASRGPVGRTPPDGKTSRKWSRGINIALGTVIMTGATLTGASETQNAIANGDTRTLSLYYAHTKETIQVTFKRSGSYDRAALKQLNWFLRDWRREEPTNMDPRLFDLVWEVYRELGSRETIQVLSAFRAPATNAMLRRRSGRVAEHSQHMLGKAMDFYLPDVSSARVRAVGVRLQRGGVGYYPSSYNPFVHLDVGSVRAWPRLSHDQLAQIFPDGKTVHIPANGRPMARYNEARAEILSRGGAVAGSTAYAADASSSKKGFWSRLFGGNDEGEDVAEQRAIAVAPAYKPRTAKEAAATAQQVAWSKGDETSGDAGLLGFLGGGRRPAEEPQIAVAEAPTADRMPPMEAQPTRIAEMAPLPASTPQDPASLAAMRSGESDAADPADKPLGIVPLPPRRPDDPELNMATAALSGEASAVNAINTAMAPLPPVRPNGLGIAAVVADVSTAGAADDAPTTVRGTATLASAMIAPLPPARPADLRRGPSDAVALAAITAGRRTDAAPVGALAYAASPETTSSLSPLPPQRPMELRGAAVTPGAARQPGVARPAPTRPASAPARSLATTKSVASDAPEVSAPQARQARARTSASAELPSRIDNAYDDATFSNNSGGGDSGAAFARALLARKLPAN